MGPKQVEKARLWDMQGQSCVSSVPLVKCLVEAALGRNDLLWLMASEGFKSISVGKAQWG